jgi:hypothetical protein
MRDDRSVSDTGPFARKPRVITTSGEILPDGTIVELVAAGHNLLLCQWDGKQHFVLSCLDVGNTVYTPPRLEPSLYSAFKFPGPPMEYGSLETLFDATAAVFEARGFSTTVGHSCALFTLASWLPEFFFHPPTLLVYGSEMMQAAVLFCLLGCLCRRSLFAAQLARSLPFWLQPTLLVLAPETTVKKCAFWRAANVRGVWVPSPGGAVGSLACARALFLNDEQALASWGTEILRVPLLPCVQPSPPTEQELTKIANEFQPRFLLFRLQRLTQMNGTPETEAQKPFANYETSRQLLALVKSEPAILTKVAPLLLEQQRECLEHQQLDPDRAMVESMWAPSHESKELSMAELGKRVNAILCSRGETIQLNSRSLGWKLRRLQLPRERNGKGKYLLFSREVQRQLHQLARKFELELPSFADCLDCKKE